MATDTAKLDSQADEVSLLEIEAEIWRFLRRKKDLPFPVIPDNSAIQHFNFIGECFVDESYTESSRIKERIIFALH